MGRGGAGGGRIRFGFGAAAAGRWEAVVWSEGARTEAMELTSPACPRAGFSPWTGRDGGPGGRLACTLSSTGKALAPVLVPTGHLLL